MAIRLIFTYQRELLRFIIDGKKILYTDRKWGKWLQCLPKDPEFAKKIAMSRNAFPAFLVKMFEFTDEEMKEYESAKDEEALAAIIIRDSGLKGCRLLSKQKVELKDGN